MISPNLPDQQLVLSVPDDTSTDRTTGFEVGNPVPLCLYAISEICNGGFHQFYSNRIFNVEQFIIDLRNLGAAKMADAVEESLRVFDNRSDALLDKLELEELMERKGFDEETWQDAEEKFYAEVPNFDAHAANYIRSQWAHYGPLIDKQ